MTKITKKKVEYIDEGLRVGDLVEWNGNKTGRIDKVIGITFGFGGQEYYTEEINPPNGQAPRHGKQFFDKFKEHTNHGVGIVKFEGENK